MESKNNENTYSFFDRDMCVSENNVALNEAHKKCKEGYWDIGN